LFRVKRKRENFQQIENIVAATIISNHGETQQFILSCKMVFDHFALDSEEKVKVVKGER